MAASDCRSEKLEAEWPARFRWVGARHQTQRVDPLVGRGQQVESSFDFADQSLDVVECRQFRIQRATPQLICAGLGHPLCHRPLEHYSGMPSELRAAVRRVRRLGNTAALAWLERAEPELTDLLLEEAGRIHRQLACGRLPAQQVRRLTRLVEHLGVTLVLAIRLCRRVTPALPIPPDRLA